MKQKNSILCGLMLIVSVLTVAHAQESNDAVVIPTPPLENAVVQKDPFITGADAEKSSKREQRGHLVILVEAYTLDQSLADKIQQQHKGSLEIHNAVKNLYEEGQVALEHIFAVPVPSGQRAVLESTDEVMYPSEFSQSTGQNIYLPNAFETRPAGVRFEVDPIINDTATVVSLSATPEFVKLTGFTTSSAVPEKDVTTAVQPLFVSRMFTTGMAVRIGQWSFFGTMSNPIDSEQQLRKVTWAFCKVHHHYVPDVAESGNVSHGTQSTDKINSVYRFYSLEKRMAAELLNSTLDGDELFKKVVNLPSEECKLERLISAVVSPNGRYKTEEVEQQVFGVSLDRGKSENGDKFNFVMRPFFSSFNMRPVGWSIEADIALTLDAVLANVTMSVEKTEYRGPLKGHRIWDQYPDMPVFGVQKTTTSVSAMLGKPCFLGTFNAPVDTGVNGRKDTGRVWLAFLEVNLE